MRLVQLAKKNNIAIILIGHVTKDGDIAGPKILEHMVDVVLYLEGERYHDMRILRGIKNRFGDSTEIGIFRMEADGLIPIASPSIELLAERLAGAGSVVTATVEGTRPLLVEVQSLTNQSFFGYPKRTASGFDVNRLNILLAVLKKCKVNLNSHDVFINVIGGINLREPAVDLAIRVSTISSFKNKPIDKDLCVFGEVGLSGELRSVRFYDRRTKEAERLGFKVLPKYRLVSEVISDLFKD
jgi:DNA repair protein RadA/Sms